MRPIKFRALNAKERRWVTVELRAGDIYLAYPGEDRTELSDWMQYTGLKDKNGVEIYEGDVLRVNTGNLDTGGIGEVIWFESGSNFAVTGYRNEPHHHALPDMCERGCMHHQLVKWLVTEVIGNIHENPDLLGKAS